MHDSFGAGLRGRLAGHTKATRALAAVSVPLLAGAVLAGCGSSGGSTAAAGATTAAASGSANGYSAYLSCLQQHGASIPARPTGARPTGARPTGARPSGGYGGGGGFGGGFGGFGGGTPDPQMSAAVAACASDRPTGGAGFGGGFGGRGGAGGGTALAAFRNCMSQQGVVIPTTRATAFPTARPTATPNPDARYLDGLDASDPKVAAALKVCSPLIPTRSAAPGAGSGAAAG